MNEIESRIRSIVVDKLGVDFAEVMPKASFANNLGVNYLDTVELIKALEKEFGISIPDNQTILSNI